MASLIQSLDEQRVKRDGTHGAGMGYGGCGGGGNHRGGGHMGMATGKRFYRMETYRPALQNVFTVGCQ